MYYNRVLIAPNIVWIHNFINNFASKNISVSDIIPISKKTYLIIVENETYRKRLIMLFSEWHVILLIKNKSTYFIYDPLGLKGLMKRQILEFCNQFNLDYKKTFVKIKFIKCQFNVNERSCWLIAINFLFRYIVLRNNINKIIFSLKKCTKKKLLHSLSIMYIYNDR